MRIKFILLLFLFIIIPVLCTYSSNLISVITINEGIGPSTTYYINNAINECEKNNYQALIIKLNTPGGLLDATRDITSLILESKIPVIVYVSPGGSRAGSAGVFITLSAHIGAMAPSTNIGAAHPVGLGGSADSSVMGKKVENDAAAFARSIAQKRNKNAEWAENAVRQSISSTENEALELNVIDLIAKDINDLVSRLNGKKIVVNNNEMTMNFSSCKIVYRDKNWKENFLSIISNPNIAYLLIMLGIYGIFFELKSPGSILPGSLGTLSLLFASYSLQILPVNYVGLGLMALGFLLFILEIFVVSYGLLTIGGIISLIFGSIMLIDSPYEFMRISMSLIISVSLITGVLIGLIIYLGLKSQNSKNTSGKFAILGETGIARTDIIPPNLGKVHVQGEIWQAKASLPIKQGEKVRIISVQSMIIEVEKENAGN